MYFFGVLLALAAGIFFGIIGPMTKFAYNAGATVEQAIFFRFIIASLIVLPLVPFQKNLIKNYYNNFKNFIIISIGSISNRKMLVVPSSKSVFAILFIFFISDSKGLDVCIFKFGL